MPYAERRLRLDGWNFNCTCSLCRASEEERAESDRRRYRLRDILAELPTYRGDARILDPVLDEVLSMVQKEDLWFLVGNYYAGFARAYLGSKDYGKARRCGLLAEGIAEKYRQEEGVAQIMGDFWRDLNDAVAI